ncbi:MAG: hypothetical protein AAFR26_23940 [Cyanobacteria bacterium J06626_4]
MPIVWLAFAVVVWALYCAAWFRILQKAQFGAVWFVAAFVPVVISPFFQPLIIAPIAILALVPWPCNKPRSVNIRR